MDIKVPSKFSEIVNTSHGHINGDIFVDKLYQGRDREKYVLAYFFGLINTVGISSKTFLQPITDTECQLWEQMLKSIFLELFHVTSAKKCATIFLNMPRSTNIITYLFSKIITVRGYASLIKTSTIFITIHQFCIFVHFTNSSLTFS